MKDNRIDTGLHKDLVKGGMWALLSKLLNYPLGLVLVMVLARQLSEADVGGYFLCISLVMLMSGLMQLGLGRVMVKLIAASLASDSPRAVKVALMTAVSILVISGAGAVVLLMSYPGEWLFSRLEDGGQLLQLIVWVASMVLTYAATEFCCEVLRGFNDIKRASLLADQFMTRLLLLVMLAGTWLLGAELDLKAVLIFAVAAAFAGALLGTWLILNKIRMLGDYGDAVSVSEVVRLAPPFLLMRINFWLLNSAAVWIIGFYHPPEVVALYGAGNMLTLLILAPWVVANSVLSPAVSVLHSQIRINELGVIARSAAAVAVAPSLLMVLLLVIFGKPLLSIIFTPSYTAAYSVLVLLSLGRLASIACGSPAMLLTMTDHQYLVLRVLMVTSIITLLGYFFAVQYAGIAGVALVSGGSLFLQSLLLSRYVVRKLDISPYPAVSRRGLKQLFNQYAGKDAV